MKKTISLALIALSVLSFGLMPVLAEEGSESNATLEQEAVTENTTADSVVSSKTTINEADTEASSNKPLQTNANNDELKGLEKIPSPDQIKLFERIKQVGASLYGVRKASGTTAMINNQERAGNTEGLEKIPSPTEINLFTQIKKIGDSLYGVKKASSTIANIQKNANSLKEEISKRIEEAKKKGLTKISSPDQMKLFENITKIGNDLFGLRKKGSNLVPAVSAEVKECVAKAIGDKDDQIIKEVEENATNIVKLVEERSACHKAALELASEREAAVTTCNNKFQEGIKNANMVRQENQKKYWNAYNEQIKTCGQKSNSEIYIQDGGEILN